jgi:hypothetical protein
LVFTMLIFKFMAQALRDFVCQSVQNLYIHSRLVRVMGEIGGKSVGAYTCSSGIP